MFDAIMRLLLYTLVVAGLVLRANGQYNYAEVLEKSIWFYEAQRSGDLPSSNRVPWRGDSAMGDGSDVGQDLTGGWYDAGDHVKFNFPMGFSTTVLSWSVVDFRNAYETTGQLTNVLDSLRWPFDYYIKCKISTTEIYGQVGDTDADHGWWGRPEEMTMARPAHVLTSSGPGSDLTGEIAASLAAGSMAFQATDPSYAATLLSHAREYYDFAYNYRGIYTDTITDARGPYPSSGYNDELCYGAAWLYRATGEADYLNKALEFYNSGVPWAFSWDDKIVGCQLILYITTGDSQYSGAVENFLRDYMPGGSIPYTPQGLVWRDTWGSLRYAANAAFIAMVAAGQNIIPTEAEPWATGQINYMLGDTGRSYVVGFGNNPPVSCHHRAASCDPLPEVCDWADASKPEPNGNIIYGALVGGPDQNDYYEDDRQNYQFNEVTCDYNAGFQGAIAGILN